MRLLVLFGLSEFPLAFPYAYGFLSDKDFQKLSSTFEPQLVVPMISSIHVPNYLMEPANQLGCSQSTSDCTLNLAHKWRTSEDLQPQCVVMKETTESCLWALSDEAAVVKALI